MTSISRVVKNPLQYHTHVKWLECFVYLTHIPTSHCQALVDFPATRYGNMSMFHRNTTLLTLQLMGLEFQPFLNTLLASFQLRGGSTWPYNEIKQLRWRIPSIPSVRRMSFVLQDMTSQLPWMDGWRRYVLHLYLELYLESPEALRFVISMRDASMYVCKIIRCGWRNSIQH